MICADGNLLNSGAGANVYAFENRLVQAGGVKLVYDGDGNRVEETVATTTTSYLVADQNLTGYPQMKTLKDTLELVAGILVTAGVLKANYGAVTRSSLPAYMMLRSGSTDANDPAP